MREHITVNLGERSYPIYIGRNTLDSVGELMIQHGLKGKAACITNPLVGSLYADRTLSSLRKAGFDTCVIEIPDGEEYKSMECLSHIYDRLIEYKMERSSPVVALGGGVIGDIAGFAAATYLRGVPYVQAPTTLLAQVDSSVGGKTAVNHPKGKNLIGAFYQPKMVLIDAELLKTLEKRDVKAGLAEVIKYGIIRDSEFFAFLEQNVEDILGLGTALLQSIKKSCSIKADVVGEDETESGLRAILNFGHTIGHAIETVADYKGVRHGEAIAIGMAAAARISSLLGLCGMEACGRIERLISAFGLPVRISDVFPQDAGRFTSNALLKAIEIDKKMVDKKVKFVMIEAIGRTLFHRISTEDFPLDMGGILN